jgi:hypothetical protein
MKLYHGEDVGDRDIISGCEVSCNHVDSASRHLPLHFLFSPFLNFTGSGIITWRRDVREVDEVLSGVGE